MLKYPVFWIEIAPGIELLHQAAVVSLALACHRVGFDGSGIAYPKQFLVAGVQGMVEVLEAAVAAEGDDRFSFAYNLKHVAQMADVQLTVLR